MKFYRITVEVEDRYAPSLRELTDWIADLLERKGAELGNYEIVTDGPPELTIGFRLR